jgi:transposase
MATRFNFKQSSQERRMRRFSDEFKQKKVREIEQKITSISEVSRTYEVRENNVSKWLDKFGTNRMKGVKTIVESESDTRKILELRAKIAELERTVGQKQILIEFQSKMLEIAQEQYGIDFKKKLESKLSSGSGKTGND